MALTTETKYIVDGKKFDTELEALGHQKFKEVEHLIEDYIAAAELSTAPAGFLRKALPAFLVHTEKTFHRALQPVAGVVAEATSEANAG